MPKAWATLATSLSALGTVMSFFAPASVPTDDPRPKGCVTLRPRAPKISASWMLKVVLLGLSKNASWCWISSELVDGPDPEEPAGWLCAPGDTAAGLAAPASAGAAVTGAACEAITNPNSAAKTI